LRLKNSGGERVYYYRIGTTPSHFPLPIALRPQMPDLPIALRASSIPGTLVELGPRGAVALLQCACSESRRPCGALLQSDWRRWTAGIPIAKIRRFFFVERASRACLAKALFAGMVGEKTITRPFCGCKIYRQEALPGSNASSHRQRAEKRRSAEKSA
jgi:hypothetical protein